MMTHIGKEREICFLGRANIQENKKIKKWEKLFTHTVYIRYCCCARSNVIWALGRVCNSWRAHTTQTHTRTYSNRAGRQAG